MIRILFRVLRLRIQISGANRALQRERKSLTVALFQMYLDVPPSVRHRARWMMTADTLGHLVTSLDPRSATYPLRSVGGDVTILGLPVVIDHDMAEHDIRLSTDPIPAGPEIGPDDDGAFCDGTDSGERAHSVFISPPKTCTTCMKAVPVYETPFGPQCRTCAAIDIAERNLERGT